VDEELDSSPSALETPKQTTICSHPPDDLDNLHLKRKVLKAPLVCTEVRRSAHSKELNKGIKVNSYNNKICLYCETPPHTLSARAMMSLGKDFCNVLVIKLSDENLKKK
jgi:hypothetical protein